MHCYWTDGDSTAILINCWGFLMQISVIVVNSLLVLYYAFKGKKAAFTRVKVAVISQSIKYALTPKENKKLNEKTCNMTTMIIYRNMSYLQNHINQLN
jgi:hypothetical protein